MVDTRARSRRFLHPVSSSYVGTLAGRGRSVRLPLRDLGQGQHAEHPSRSRARTALSALAAQVEPLGPPTPSFRTDPDLPHTRPQPAGPQRAARGRLEGASALSSRLTRCALAAQPPGCGHATSEARVPSPVPRSRLRSPSPPTLSATCCTGARLKPNACTPAQPRSLLRFGAGTGPLCRVSPLFPPLRGVYMVACG